MDWSQLHLVHEFQAEAYAFWEELAMEPCMKVATWIPTPVPVTAAVKVSRLSGGGPPPWGGAGLGVPGLLMEEAASEGVEWRDSSVLAATLSPPNRVLSESGIFDPLPASRGPLE